MADPDGIVESNPRRRLVILALFAVVVVGVGGFVLLDGGDDGSTTAGTGLTDTPFETPDGEAVPLSTFDGRPVVLNFFASWCGPCIAELPDIETVSRIYGDRVEFISVAFNDRVDDAERMIGETGVTYRWGFDADGSLFEEFGGTVMPTTVLLRADGSVAEVHSGILTVSSLTDLLEAELL